MTSPQTPLSEGSLAAVSSQPTAVAGAPPDINAQLPAASGWRRFTLAWLLDRPPLHVTLTYLAAMTLAEVLTTLIDARVGLLMNSVLLFVILLHTALAWETPLHRLLVTLAFAPLIRLLSLSLPLAEFPRVYWYFITSVPLFVAAFLVARLLDFSLDDLGINLRALPAQGLVTLSGLAFGFFEFQILQPDPLVSVFTWQQLLLPATILLFSTGFLEELIFRGLMQNTAMQVLGRFGLVYVALIFAVLHIGYKSVVDVLFVFAVGFFFGWVVLKTRSIVGVTLSHGLTNIMLFLVMPFLAAGAG